MRKQYLVLFCSVLLFAGCSSEKKAETSIMNTPSPSTEKSTVSLQPSPQKEKLHVINVSLYSNNTKVNTTKNQPMLVDVYYLLTQVQECEAIISVTQKANITFDNIRRLYSLQFNYETNNRVTKTSHYLLVTKTNGEKYIKPFSISPAFDYETFTEDDYKEVLEKVGDQDWTKVEQDTKLFY